MEEQILAVLSGEATRQEVCALERWRNESPENERVYQEYVRTWQAVALYESPQPSTAPPALEQILIAGDRRRRRAIPLKARHTQRSSSWIWTAVVATAATVVLVVFGVSALWNDSPDVVFVTGPNETRTISFDDGTIVRLGANSTLESWSDQPRRAKLSGLGFFAVASDSTAPFLVRTRAGRAEVLGTRFEISIAEDSLRLIVVEGLVSLSAADQVVEVPAGAMSSIVAGTAPTAVEEVDVWNLLGWDEGLLIFQDTPLEDVVSEVGAFFGVPISIMDTTLFGRLVTAWFEEESFEDVLGTICEVVGATCLLGDTVEMSL